MRRISLAVLVLLLFMPSTSQSQAQTARLRVLLTNDDGIDAEGLQALVRAFAPVAETYVIAPLANKSGSTNYISAIATRTLEVEQRDLGEGITAYGVAGFPADAIVFALRGLLVDNPPDVVISGVNGGPNLSDDWNLSGTVGAAQIAAFFGVPATAVSGYSDEHPETLAALSSWVVELASSPLVRNLEPGQYLTVSVPRVPAAQIAGVDIVRRGPRPWRLQLSRAERPASAPSRQVWSLRFEPRQLEPPPGTDLAAYAANRIAIVAMRADEHDPLLSTLLAEAASQIPAWKAPGGG